jgi:hypothetical protein
VTYFPIFYYVLQYLVYWNSCSNSVWVHLLKTCFVCLTSLTRNSVICSRQQILFDLSSQELLLLLLFNCNWVDTRWQ